MFMEPFIDSFESFSHWGGDSYAEISLNQFYLDESEHIIPQSTSSELAHTLKQIIVVNEKDEEKYTYMQMLKIEEDETINYDAMIKMILEVHPELSKFEFLLWNDIKGQYAQLSSKLDGDQRKISLQDLRNSESIYMKYQATTEKLPEKAPKKKKNMKKEKRIKERGIGEVIEKVQAWRKLHEEDPKLNLDQAAQAIGISRKTLDDYNLQIRRATEMGFDFKKHIDSKMGVLRKFVKKPATATPAPSQDSEKSSPDQELSSSETNVVQDIDVYLSTEFRDLAESTLNLEEGSPLFNFEYSEML